MSILNFSTTVLKPRTSLLARTHRLFHISKHSCKQISLDGKTIRIGSASGFWGDTATAAPQLVQHGGIHYLVMDYLSEITMSLMTAAKKKYPNLGFAPDFVQVVIAPLLKLIIEKEIRVITNAGGVNPAACAEAIHNVAKSAGIDGVKVAVVNGDDLMSVKDEVQQGNYKDIDSMQPMPKEIQSMNAYLGAGPIVKALQADANIVITGRCTDSALILAPLMYEFNWRPDEYNKLAAGSLAGHLIECGAQCTGGIYTDWENVPDWHNIGFPIAECADNGDFFITKPMNTGGLVNQSSVSEQLVYEIGDPSRYLLPDVTCDFTNVTITDVPGNKNQAVFVTGAKGLPPTNSYKVSATYSSGYRSTAVCCVGGKNAKVKGKKTAEQILKRVRNMFKFVGFEDFSRVNIQVIGSHDWVGNNPPEAVVWIAVEHTNKKALELFSREIAPAGTGMAPGLSAIVGGRPKASPVFRLFSFLYPKDQLQTNIEVNGEHVGTYTAPLFEESTSEPAAQFTRETGEDIKVGDRTYTVEQLAYTRSGDKGNHCNIGVIARDVSHVPYLRRYLTAERVEQYFSDVFDGGEPGSRVKRYELPGINGFNFMLLNSLGGGGVASLRTDPQGKAFGQRLVDLKIDNLPDLDDTIKKTVE